MRGARAHDRERGQLPGDILGVKAGRVMRNDRQKRPQGIRKAGVKRDAAMLVRFLPGLISQFGARPLGPGIRIGRRDGARREGDRAAVQIAQDADIHEVADKDVASLGLLVEGRLKCEHLVV